MSLGCADGSVVLLSHCSCCEPLFVWEVGIHFMFVVLCGGLCCVVRVRAFGVGGWVGVWVRVHVLQGRVIPPDR